MHTKILKIWFTLIFLLPVVVSHAQDLVEVSKADKSAFRARALELINEQQLVAPEKPTATPESKVLAALEFWRVAWVARDTASYLGSYSADFIPEEGVSRDAWAEKRKLAMGRAREVVLELADVKIELLDMEHAISTFRQTYRSTAYRDVVSKKIEWRKNGSRWLIVSESRLASAPK
jgi:hypothetical protein